MTLRQSALAATTLVVLTGCAAVSPLPELAAATMSVCDIRTAGVSLLGDRIRTSGTYESDSMTYGYIVDESCGREANSIDIGKAWGIDEYDELREQWTRECNLRGEHFCVVSEDVVLVGVINKSDEGDFLVLDLERISIK